MIIRRKQKHFGAEEGDDIGQPLACAMREHSGNCDALICGRAIIRCTQKHFGTAGRAHEIGQPLACAVREPSGICDALSCGTIDSPPQAKTFRRGGRARDWPCAMRALSGRRETFICWTNGNPPQEKSLRHGRAGGTSSAGRLRARYVNLPSAATLLSADER